MWRDVCLILERRLFLRDQSSSLIMKYNNNKGPIYEFNYLETLSLNDI